MPAKQKPKKQPRKQPSKNPTTAPTSAWPATELALDPAVIAAAYQQVRPALAKDVLFTKAAADFAVSLAELDARMRKPPADPTRSDDLYLWLDGADQYRYAGLLVLLRALGGAPAVTLPGPIRVPATATRIARGDVTIDGDLALESQAMVIVLGTLRVKGGVFAAPHDYSLVAARAIECLGGVTGGELIATERIVATGPFYFAGNDYSARAPLFQGNLLVDFERGNAFTRVKVKKRITAWDFPAAARALGVTGDDDLARAFLAKHGWGAL